MAARALEIAVNAREKTAAAKHADEPIWRRVFQLRAARAAGRR